LKQNQGIPNDFGLTLVEEGTCFQLLERRIHDHWCFANRQRVFVDGRKNLKLKKSYLEYVTSSVEESTMEIEVNTNNSSSKDEVDLYALEVVLNHKKNVHLPMQL